MRGLACSAEFMRRVECLARQAGWEPGQGRREAKKPVVQALSHHLCLGPNTIYQLLKSIEITARSGICDIANNPESPHPSIAVAASRAGDEAPEVLKQAVEEGWTAKQVRAEVKRRKQAKRPPLPAGVFDVILADPPWPYDIRIPAEHEEFSLL